MATMTAALRATIQKYREQKKTYREIATLTGLSKSTIGYEIKNYSNPNGLYDAQHAHWLAQKRAHSKNKNRYKQKNSELLQIVDKEIKKKRSPKDIEFLLKNRYPDQKNLQVSHETIYKLAYQLQKVRGNICSDWWEYLPRKRRKRRFRSKLSKIGKRPSPRSIHAMKPGIKQSFGVWQVDIMYLKHGYVFVAVETVSKKIMAQMVYDLKAQTIQKACRFLFARVDKITAIICDCGSENSGFKDWQRMLHTVVYSCDPGKPYQKGLVEQTNATLRKYLPRNTDARLLKQKNIYKFVALLNNMHRVSLNGRKAREVYACPNLRLK